MNTNLSWRNLLGTLYEKGLDIKTDSNDKITQVVLHGSHGEGVIYRVDVPKEGTVNHSILISNDYEFFQFELNIHNGEIEKLLLSFGKEDSIYFHENESNISFKFDKPRKTYSSITDKKISA